MSRFWADHEHPDRWAPGRSHDRPRRHRRGDAVHRLPRSTSGRAAPGEPRHRTNGPGYRIRGEWHVGRGRLDPRARRADLADPLTFATSPGDFFGSHSRSMWSSAEPDTALARRKSRGKLESFSRARILSSNISSG